MDGSTLLMIGLVAVPAMPALLEGSFPGFVLAGIIAFAGCTTFVFHPLFGGGIWLLAWVVSTMIGASRHRRRDDERKHQELLQAIAAGRGELPPR